MSEKCLNCKKEGKYKVMTYDDEIIAWLCEEHKSKFENFINFDEMEPLQTTYIMRCHHCSTIYFTKRTKGCPVCFKHDYEILYTTKFRIPFLRRKMNEFFKKAKKDLKEAQKMFIEYIEKQMKEVK